MKLIEIVRHDARRLLRYEPGRAWWWAFGRRTFMPVFTLRLCQSASRSGILVRMTLGVVARLWHRRACRIAGIDLPWTTRVGPGLAIVHGWGLVVSPGATLGADCTLFHGATLGEDSDGIRKSGFPTLGDQVVVGAHAMVLGAVSVGANVFLAPGTVVVKAVPAGVVVVGNPMRILWGASVDEGQPATAPDAGQPDAGEGRRP